MRQRRDSADSNDSLLGQLMEEYVARQRAGSRPTIAEYAASYPHLADDIRELFPMCGFLDHVGDSEGTDHSAHRSTFASLAPNTVLGEYRILREIGRGGMGVVYEAEHTTLKRRVALKVLPRRSRSQVHKERFYREARAAAKLHHTNIVPVFDFGEDRDIPYYAMQFIEGRGLDQFVTWAKDNTDEIGSGSISGFWQQLGKLRADSQSDSSGSNAAGLNRWRYLARLGMQAAQALHHAHELGVIHRDVKPSNLILDSTHHLWITDFGLAKVDDDQDLTTTGDLVGTLRYLPPEALQGKAGALGDVYGLGLVLYEIVSLQRPYDEDSKLGIIRQITDQGPAALSAVRSTIPRDLQVIIHKAIDRDPAARYASAAELAADLGRFIDDKPITARPHTTFSIAKRWARRNPLAASLAGLVVLLVTLGFLISTVFSIHLSRQRTTALRRLFDSRLAEAAAGRHSEHIGQRFETIAAVEEAATLVDDFSDDPEAEFKLRSELIGALGLADLRVLQTWSHEFFERYSFDYHSGSRVLLFLSHNRQLVAHAVEDDQRLFSLPTTNRVNNPRISPNGRWAAWTQAAEAGDSDLVVVHLQKDGPEKARFSVGARHQFCFDAGNRIAFVDPDGTSLVYDLQHDETVALLPAPNGKIGRFSLSSDASRIAANVVNSAKSTLQAWDLSSQDRIFDQELNFTCEAIAWNNDASQLAIGTDMCLELWDVKTGKRKLRAPHNATVFHVAYSVDSRSVFASTWGHSTSIWSTASGNRLLQVDGTIGWSPTVGHNNEIAVHLGRNIEFVEYNSGKERQTVLPADWPSSASSATQSDVHPDGRLAAVSTSYGFRLGDAVSGQAHEDVYSEFSYFLRFSPDGKFLLQFSDGVAKQWPITLDGSGRAVAMGMPIEVELPSEGFINLVVEANRECVAFSKKGLVFLSYFRNGSSPSVITTGTQENPSGILTALHLATTRGFFAEGRKYVLRDLANNTSLAYIDRSTAMSNVSFSPDGNSAIFISENDLTVYDVPSLAIRYRIPNVNFRQGLTTFTNDGEIAVLAQSEPPGALLIEVATGRKLAMFPASRASVPRNIRPIICPSTNRLVSFDTSNSVVSWNLASIRRQLRAYNLDWDGHDISTDSHLDERPVEFSVQWDGQRREMMKRLLERDRRPHVLKRLADEFLKKKQAPGDTDAYVVRALALLRIGRLRDADRLLRHVVTLDPTDWEAYEILEEVASGLSTTPP